MVKVTRTRTGVLGSMECRVEEGRYCAQVFRHRPTAWCYFVRPVDGRGLPIETGTADTLLDAVATAASAVARWDRAGWKETD